MNYIVKGRGFRFFRVPHSAGYHIPLLRDIADDVKMDKGDRRHSQTTGKEKATDRQEGGESDGRRNKRQY
jgi:hypothetical protein